MGRFDLRLYGLILWPTAGALPRTPGYLRPDERGAFGFGVGTSERGAM